MLNRFIRIMGLLLAVALLMDQARAQSPSPDSITAAKELITTIKLADQFQNMMPMMMDQLKPAIVQGRPDVDRDYDAMVPVLLEGFRARIAELLNATAAIYAANFTGDELRALTAFYKTPVGQKFLQRQPVIVQQTMNAGRQFGESVGAGLKQQMIDELRKKGHNI